MNKFIKKFRKGFTLVELIVVIAIVAILSTVGFVSYTGYIRDARNSVRESDLAEGINVITQFIATEGRNPNCTTGVQCYFASGNHNSGGSVVAGIASADWDKMNVRKSPADPKKNAASQAISYKYSSGGGEFWLGATKEDSTGGFTAIVKGSKEGAAAGMTGLDNANASCSSVAPGGTCVPYKF